MATIIIIIDCRGNHNQIPYENSSLPNTYFWSDKPNGIILMKYIYSDVSVHHVWPDIKHVSLIMSWGILETI